MSEKSGTPPGSWYAIEVYGDWQQSAVVVHVATTRRDANRYFREMCQEHPKKDVYLSYYAEDGSLIDVMDSRVVSMEGMPKSRGGRIT
jgi:predicted SnoaL-like aldol condensation-catalyzing enzyme